MAKASIETLHHPPPPREVLADAIARHVAAIDSVKRVQQAHEAAGEIVFRNADTLAAAQAQLDDARANEGRYLAAAALGEGGDLLSVADAELAVTKATNDLTVARRTRDALAERSNREIAEVTKAERTLHDAVVNVIKSEVPITTLLDRAQQLQRDLIAARLEIRWLQRMNCVPADAETAVRTFLLDASLPAGVGAIENGNWSGTQHPATERWLTAAADLKANASANLPKV